MRKAVCMIVLGLLAACASPREQCLAQAGAELRTLDRLIAEVEGNIARGYGIARETVVTTVLERCRHPDDPFLFCHTPVSRVQERPVALDMAAEARKLADLRARRAVEARRAEAAAAACPAA